MADEVASRARTVEYGRVCTRISERRGNVETACWVRRARRGESAARLSGQLAARTTVARVSVCYVSPIKCLPRPCSLGAKCSPFLTILLSEAVNKQASTIWTPSRREAISCGSPTDLGPFRPASPPYAHCGEGALDAARVPHLHATDEKEKCRWRGENEREREMVKCGKDDVSVAQTAREHEGLAEGQLCSRERECTCARLRTCVCARVHV
eukprot:6212203-Pleurochrysis_carterae.AAC.2